MINSSSPHQKQSTLAPHVHPPPLSIFPPPGHVQLFKTMWDRKRKFYTVPVEKKAQAEN